MEAKLAAALVKVFAVLLIMGVLGWWGYSWKSKYETLLAADFQKTAAEQTARADDLDKKLTQVKATLANNAQVMNDLAQQHDSDSANLQRTNELVKRLFIAATAPRPTRGPVSAPNSGPGAPGSSPGQGDASLGDLLAGVAAEYRHNALQLNALIAEIKPQL